MTISSLRRRYVGDKAFYAMVLHITVPIIIQSAITNFVSLLDNIMVGRIGTEQMSGVSIANQLLFVYLLCIGGGLGGAGIFTAQYYGKGDSEGVRYTMRFKMLLALVLSGAAAVVLLAWGTPLIRLFLHDGAAGGDLQLTLHAGQQYLRLMLWEIIPYALSQVYTSTLREVGETALPMKAGVAAVLVNLVLNWVLIYGHLGFAPMGVVGAAVATVASRVVECAIVMVWAHLHARRFSFLHGVWRSLRIPAALAGSMLRRGTPLLVNEGLWSFALTAINQCYSTRGLAVVAALNISSTIVNLFNTIYMSLGMAVGIVVGQLLGQGRPQQAVDTDRKMIAFSMALCVGIGGSMAALAGLFPQLYNTGHEVRALAAYFIRLSGLLMPMYAFLHCAYFTLRCGGRTGVTFLFDCAFMCCVNLPLAWVLSRLTALDIRTLYLLCQCSDLAKCVVGFILVKKRIWVHNIVGVRMEGDAAPPQAPDAG